MNLPRGLRELEKSVAREVFQEVLPFSRIYLSDGLGKNGRPFTLPVTLVQEMSPTWSIAIGALGKWISDKVAPAARYIIFVGDAYDQGLNSTDSNKRTLIHELTHVWQGENSDWTWGYVFNSLHHQLIRGEHAYDYDPDKLGESEWDDYNVEQQANIVEDWYSGGKKETDPRYKFVKSVIRDV